MDTQDKRLYIKELQNLQRQINFLQQTNAAYPSQHFTNSIKHLQNAQNKLYGSLVKNGVTAEEVNKIIERNNDNELVKTVIKLQKSKDRAEQRLSSSNLSPEKRQSLQIALARKEREHAEKWNEIIDSPNKDELIREIEKAHAKKKAKTRGSSRAR